MNKKQHTCPHCGATLDEGARFCLYCMTSLVDKEDVSPAPQRSKTPVSMLLAITTLIVLVVTATVMILLMGDDSSERLAIQDTTITTTTSAAATTTTAAATASSTATASTSTEDTVIWHYKEAGSSDYMYNYNDIAIEDAILITGFDRVSDSGVYRIPAMIDGKTVVAIDMRVGDGYTFSHPAVCDTVTAVYLPPALNTIHGTPFEACVLLKEIYIEGEYLLMDPAALPPVEMRQETLTLYSSETCWCLHGGKLLSVYCSFGWNKYDCEWEEWP